MFYRDLSCDNIIIHNITTRILYGIQLVVQKRNKVKIQNVLFKNLCFRNANISKMTYFFSQIKTFYKSSMQ